LGNVVPNVRKHLSNEIEKVGNQMFGRTKGKAQDATPSAAEVAEGGSPPAPKVPPADQVRRQRAAIAVRHSLAFSQIVSLLMRSAQHRRYPIAALQWLVLPPLLTGQFSIAEARSKENGASAPVAVALWAKVSPEVDKRLSEALEQPIQLRPREWRSGDIPWLVAAIGDPRAMPQFLKHLGETVFKGQEVKIRGRGPDGKVIVQMLSSATAASG
jgi:cytolysin-activating lysine-acyltransferase